MKNMSFRKIKYLDGKRLRNAILASSKIVSRNKDHLNKINVFPVPDGDTGTNMAHTMDHISSNLSQVSDKSVSHISSVLAESALMGAQGNSGAILAQFFHGFSTAVKGKLRLSTAAFAEAVKHARLSAHNALSEPREGTILTVISDWANYIEKASKRTEDFVELLKNGLQTARQSLADTPKKLEVLRKAGVVDAGAQGFVNMLEGIVNFIDKGRIKQILHQSKIEPASPTGYAGAALNMDITFRFCTECMIQGEEISHSSLREQLLPLGDSLIVAGSAERVRIHMHTNSPEAVFKIASSFGSLSHQKIDDMIQQHQHVLAETELGEIGIVTDSSCDLPYQFIQENNIHIIPLKIIFGPKTYLDKVDISPMEFYDKLVTSEFHPTTSQPATADVQRVFQTALTKYKSLISIHLPRASSGTLQVIERVAKSFEHKKIVCIDGKNISAALGLVVMEAAEAIKENLALDKVVERVNKAVENLHILITLASLKYVVKGGRLSKKKGFIGNLLRLKPTISLNQEGRVFLAFKAIGHKNAMKKTLNQISIEARKYKRVKFIIAHANALKKAEWYARQLTKRFNLTEMIPIVEAAPALGVHAGPGTAGIAFVGYND